MHSAVTALEILTKARELITDPAKWGQGLSYWRSGTCCATEALLVCAGADPFAYDFIGVPHENAEAHDEAVDAVFKIVNEAITQWNDMKHRTHGDVLRVFDKAIEQVKADAAIARLDQRLDEKAAS